MSNAKNKRRKAHKIAQRRERVSELYLNGETVQEIAQNLGVGSSTVSRDLSALRQQWRAAAATNTDLQIKAELARIDQTEQEAWKAFDRSHGKTVTVTTEKGDKERGKVDFTTERVEYLAGNPSFLKLVLQCSRERRELLGLNADKGGGDREFRLIIEDSNPPKWDAQRSHGD